MQEPSFSSDSELLAAASALEPLDLDHDSNLALLACSCCCRLAERQLRHDWRAACRWCALGRSLERSEGPTWAAQRFRRLFNASEALRIAARQGVSELSQCRECLLSCESLYKSWPTCSNCPESIYTCCLALVALKHATCRLGRGVLAPEGPLIS